MFVSHPNSFLRRDGLRDGYQTPTVRKPMKRTLVIANQTLGGEALLARVREGIVGAGRLLRRRSCNAC